MKPKIKVFVEFRNSMSNHKWMAKRLVTVHLKRKRIFYKETALQQEKREYIKLIETWRNNRVEKNETTKLTNGSLYLNISKND